MYWNIFILGAIFKLIMCGYFGNNLTPKSDPEIICTGILIIILSVCILSYNLTQPNKPNSDPTEED